MSSDPEDRDHNFNDFFTKFGYNIINLVTGIIMKEKDKTRLRELGVQLAEIASLPIQDKNKKLWIAMNDLRAARPLVNTRDYPYFILEYRDELHTTIEDPFLKDIEQTLLLRIYEWNHLRTDRVIEPFIDCPVVYSDSRFGTEGYRPGTDNVSREYLNTAKHYEQVIFPDDDIESKIKIPVVEYNKNATMERFGLLSGIFSGIIPVKLSGQSRFACTPMDDIITWTGIGNAFVYMAEEPDFMHKLVSRYMEAQISRIKQYESLGILSSNNSSKNIGNNCPGFTSQLPVPTESGIGAKINDIWGDNADQIMTSVSPEMTKEFCFDHEEEWAGMFKLYSYGCCEKLDNKLGILKKSFPNLRKVSSSPFNDLEKTAEQLGAEFVISFKPNSAYLAGEKTEMELLRKEIEHGCILAKKYNLNLVFNMKTMITLNEEPQRLWNWCTMAMDTVKKYFGD